MDTNKKGKTLLTAAGIAVALSGLILLTKSLITGSSRTLGIVFLSIGMVVLVIAMANRGDNARGHDQ